MNAVQVGMHEATLSAFANAKKYGRKQTIADSMGNKGHLPGCEDEPPKKMT